MQSDQEFWKGMLKDGLVDCDWVPAQEKRKGKSKKPSSRGTNSPPQIVDLARKYKARVNRVQSAQQNIGQKWNKKRRDELEEVVKRRYPDFWNLIAEDLGAAHTGQECMDQWFE